MKKAGLWIWSLAVVVFLIDWTIVGLAVLNGNYNIAAGVYIGAGCLAVILLFPFFRLFGGRCPHCGRDLAFGETRYPHCGGRIAPKRL